MKNINYCVKPKMNASHLDLGELVQTMADIVKEEFEIDGIDMPKIEFMKSSEELNVKIPPLFYGLYFPREHIISIPPIYSTDFKIEALAEEVAHSYTMTYRRRHKLDDLDSLVKSVDEFFGMLGRLVVCERLKGTKYEPFLDEDFNKPIPMERIEETLKHMYPVKPMEDVSAESQMFSTFSFPSDVSHKIGYDGAFKAIEEVKENKTTLKELLDMPEHEIEESYFRITKSKINKLIAKYRSAYAEYLEQHN